MYNQYVCISFYIHDIIIYVWDIYMHTYCTGPYYRVFWSLIKREKYTGLKGIRLVWLVVPRFV